MSEPAKARVTVLQWAALLLGVLLFISDFGLDVWAKPVPQSVYWLCLAVFVGVDLGAIKELLLQVARNFANKAGEP